MAASEVLKHLYDGKLTITDGTTPTPVSLVIPFTVGDFKLSGLSADQADIKIYKVRGKTQTVRVGESTEPSGSFSCLIADYSDVTDQTVIDFVLQQGSYSGNVSTLSNGDATTSHLQWDVEGVSLGDASDHSIECDDCIVTMDLSEGEPNSASFSFTVLGGSPTMT